MPEKYRSELKFEFKTDEQDRQEIKKWLAEHRDGKFEIEETGTGEIIVRLSSCSDAVSLKLKWA